MTAPLLDLVDEVVGRQPELLRLDGALEAAGRAGGCVLLTGAPGVGKSALAHAFGRAVARQDGGFGYGRCREGVQAPYAAVGEALGGLVATMRAAPGGERDRWQADLARELSGIADGLGVLVPELAALVGGPSPAGAPAPADGRIRLHRSVGRLLTVTAGYRPVVLAVDDLQWADEDSLLLLAEVLGAGIRNLLLLGAHRTGEFDPGRLVVPADRLGTLELAPLSTGQLVALLGAVCGEGPELDEVAAEFHRRTGGNPLQVRQLLRRAQAVGALRPAGAGARPVWDLAALDRIEITADAAAFLGSAIDQLPPAERAVLGALACLGGEFGLDDAVAAAARPAEQVARAVWAALDLRLLEAVDQHGFRIAPVIDRSVRYRLSHDRVAEAARARLAEPERRAVHLRIGRRLAGLGDDRLFPAAYHLGIGGLDVADAAERTGFARLQLRAAGVAGAQASFPVALACSRAGLALLGERRWAEQPALTRELQLAAAEAAYLVSDFTLADRLLDEAAGELADPADRGRLAFVRLKSQVAQHELQQALETGRRALDELGHPLPRRTGKPRIIAAELRNRLRLRGWDDERLLRLPRCTDPRLIEVHRILDELRSVAFLAAPELVAPIVHKELQLITAHGLAASSPVTIVGYGLLLVAAGDYAGSQRFGELGLRLTERAEFRAARPAVTFFYAAFVRHWRHPMREGLPLLQEAFGEAVLHGDPATAGRLATTLIYQSFFAGRPLAEIDALAQSLLPEFRSHRTTSLLSRSTQQFCLNLMGRSADPFLLAGESGYDEREVLPVARREHDRVAQSAAAITKLGLHFWCGDDAGGLPLAEETARCLVGQTGTSNVQNFHMLNALIRIRTAPGDRATARAVRRSLALHRSWAAVGPANYAAPLELIEAVWARARGALDDAERHIGRAIELAERYQLPLISGLAHEEAGSLHAQTGRAAQSRDMLRAAHLRWTRLGLLVRRDRLERTHPWLLGSTGQRWDVVGPGSATVDRAAVRHLLQAVPEAATAEALTELVLDAASQLTGAARVVLLLGDPRQPPVRAVREIDGTTRAGPGIEVAHDRALVTQALRGGQPRGGPAALAVPVLVRGAPVGALYLEHPHPPAGFDTEQVVALTALCAQAAGPLWSFELEGRLRAAEQDRRSLIDVQSRFIPAELLRILDVDDIRRVRRGARVERRMTVLISDIRGYTALLEGMSVAEASDVAMGFLRAVEMPIITSNGLLQDVRGDEVLAVFQAGPDDAVRAGLAMLRSLREHNRERVRRGADELRVGIGINTGPVALGLVGGVNRMALTVLGDAVNLAGRVESASKRYGCPLLLSEHAHAELAEPDRFAIRRLERVAVVNRRAPVTLYEVYDEDPAPLRAAKRAAQPAFDAAFALFDAGRAEAAAAAFERCRELLPDDPVAPLHLAHCAELASGAMRPGQEVVLGRK